MKLADAQKDFANLVEKVHREGVSIDLERDNQVIARLTPATLHSQLTIGELPAFLRSLPSLGDDADAFAQDLRDIRSSFPMETSPWD